MALAFRSARKAGHAVVLSTVKTAVPVGRLAGVRALPAFGRGCRFALNEFPVYSRLRCFSAVTVKTPDLGGESITEGAIMEWKVKVGDQVQKEDLLCVIETDKVSMEVRAQEAGTIKELLKKVDDTVEVGQPLLTMLPGASAGSAAPSSAPKQQPAEAQSGSGPMKDVEVKVQDFGGESITEGTMQEWKFKVGEYVNKGDIIASIETDKVSVDVVASESGILSEIFKKVDDTVEVDQAICNIKAGGAAPAAKPADVPPPEKIAESPKPAAAAKQELKSVPVQEGGREETRKKMTRMRQTIARNLKGAQETQATLTTFNEVDMTGLMALRKDYKDAFEKAHGVKFGLQSIFFKAAANALLEVPAVNAHIDGGDVVYRDYVDIGFAAATSRGLVVPIIRDVETLGIVGIERAFAELAGKAKEDKITLQDMEGGTFNISNGGVFGSMLGTPMIGSTNLSAVLGLHATKMRPVVMPDGSIKARPIMYVALTYDHRLVDGREAVTFLSSIRDQVEKPECMLLGL